MHVSSALNTIKKRGTFKAYRKAQEAYVDQQEAAKEAKIKCTSSQPPQAKARKPIRKGLRKLPRRLLGRTALRKRRLLRRPRNVRLWPTLQPQNLAQSIRPSTRKPPLQKRPPQSRRMLLRPRFFSFTQICYLWMQSTH